LWNLRSDGYDAAACLDFDFAVMDWWDRFGAFRQEQKLSSVQHTPKGRTYVPKYATDADILREKYGVGRPDGQRGDPVVAGLSDADLWDAVDGWDA
jgi:hypothetical protein